MKKRDIFLDFTSVFDVTLRVIFFLFLFSHFDSEANKARTDEKVKEYDVAIHQAEERELSAKQMEEQLKNEIDTVMQANQRIGENAKEIIDFNQSGNIKILLKIDNGSWSIQIIKDGDLLDTILPGTTFERDLKKAFDEAGYNTDSTIFCDFIFDGSQVGSASAYRQIRKGLTETLSIYKHLYISETDLSVGGE